jgi:hypothetical protein
MGPALFAYRPWLDDGGRPAPPGAHVEETVLLLYESSQDTSEVERCLDGYQHPDEWEGGAWVTTNADKSAVLFAGTKGTGAKYWYGYINPDGPEHPCVDEELVGEFAVCWLADGTPCPPEDLTECAGHNDYRGWWSARFDAQFILYDPADLARVAAGEIASWEPQPYAFLDIDEYLFLNPAGVEGDMLGTGVQRRFRIGAVAYDRSNAFLVEGAVSGRRATARFPGFRETQDLGSPPVDCCWRFTGEIAKGAGCFSYFCAMSACCVVQHGHFFGQQHSRWGTIRSQGAKVIRSDPRPEPAKQELPGSASGRFAKSPY